MKEPLVRLNGREMNPIECQYDSSHTEELIISNNNLAAEIKGLQVAVTTLSGHHKEVIRYLLIVVCVIALGRTALDLALKAIPKAITTTTDNQ